MDEGVIQKISAIRCLITDIDGVLTDGYIYLDTNGYEQKRFHVHDGMGLKLLMHSGIDVAVITTSCNEIIDKRMQQLGIKYVYSGQRNKKPAFEQLKQQLKLSNEQFAYIGDDLPDVDILKEVGLAITVKDCAPGISQYAHWQTKKVSGKGAVREVCDLILKQNGTAEKAIQHYLS